MSDGPWKGRPRPEANYQSLIEVRILEHPAQIYPVYMTLLLQDAQKSVHSLALKDAEAAMKLGLLLLPVACLAGAAVADPGGEIGYPEGSLGYDALVKANYQTAERQILDSRVAKDDPARLINLGQIYSKTGRTDMAIRVLEAAMRSEEVELILANGEVISSRDAARRALATIRK